jgi:hypothetical protein
VKPEIDWEISTVQSKALLMGFEQTGAGDFSLPVMIKLLTATVLGGEEYGSAYDVTDNELLGVKESTEEELKRLIAEKVI